MTTTDESGYETGGPLGGGSEGSPRDRDHVILDSLPLKKKKEVILLKDDYDANDDDAQKSVKVIDKLDQVEEEEGDDDDDVSGIHIEGQYDPEEFKDLDVSAEIRNLFQYIQHYQAENLELDAKLKPFIQDYIPAVGDTDPFIKVQGVNLGEPNNNKLGLHVLDEPAARQTDQSVLELQLRAVSKEGKNTEVHIRKLREGGDTKRYLEKWVQDIWEMHRNQPAPSVQYTTFMPSIEFLVQEWPAEVESSLDFMSLTVAELDLKLENLVDLLCAALDIPIAKSRLQSLHVLFNLFLTCRQTNSLLSDHDFLP